MQYSVGGLFHWVQHGFVNEGVYQAGWSKARKVEEEVQNAKWWADATNLFSILDELAKLCL